MDPDVNQEQTPVTSTEPVAAPKQTVAEKVNALNEEKTALTANLNSIPEAEKASVQERIATIDRKLRWYAGRSGEAKVRPTPAPKAPKEPKAKKAKAVEPAAPEAPLVPVPPAANES